MYRNKPPKKHLENNPKSARVRTYAYTPIYVIIIIKKYIKIEKKKEKMTFLRNKIKESQNSQ